MCSGAGGPFQDSAVGSLLRGTEGAHRRRETVLSEWHQDLPADVARHVGRDRPGGDRNHDLPEAAGAVEKALLLTVVAHANHTSQTVCVPVIVASGSCACPIDAAGWLVNGF
jgi:hypothetical protein